MFLCGECGAVFERPRAAFDVWLEHFGHPCREEFDVCPDCGSDDLMRAVRCASCREYVREDEAQAGFGPACTLAVVRRLGAFADTLTQEEKELLNTLYAGSDAFV